MVSDSTRPFRVEAMPEDLLSLNSTPLLLGNTQRAFVLNTAIPRRSVYWSLIISNKDVKSETKWKHQITCVYNINIYIYVTVCVHTHCSVVHLQVLLLSPILFGYLLPIAEIWTRWAHSSISTTLACWRRVGAWLRKDSFVTFIGKPLFLRGKNRWRISGFPEMKIRNIPEMDWFDLRERNISMIFNGLDACRKEWMGCYQPTTKTYQNHVQATCLVFPKA